MSNLFLEYFLRTCSEICSACIVQNGKEDTEYQEVSKKFSNLFSQIADKLDEDSDLIYRFEEVVNQRNCLEEDWIYQQGFCDCMYLLKWMNAFSLS